MPTWYVVGAEFDVRLSNAVVQAFGITKLQFARRFDDRGPMLDEKVVEKSVADHRHLSFARLVELYVDCRFRRFVTQRNSHLYCPLLHLQHKASNAVAASFVNAVT